MKILWLFLMGSIAGAIDIFPMIKMKIDKYSILSAFLFHLIAPFILYSLGTSIAFWLGGLIYLLLATPTIVLVARDDKKSVPIMCVSSLIIGTMIGVIQHFFI